VAAIALADSMIKSSFAVRDGVAHRAMCCGRRPSAKQSQTICGLGDLSMDEQVAMTTCSIATLANPAVPLPANPVSQQGRRRQGNTTGSNGSIGDVVEIMDGARIGQSCVAALGNVVMGFVLRRALAGGRAAVRPDYSSPKGPSLRALRLEH
jgi:hypothetical protein